MKKHYSLFCAATLISFLSFSQFEQRPFTFSDASVLNYPEVKPIATSIGFQKSTLWTETFAGIGSGSGATNGPAFNTANGTWTTNGINGDIWKHTYYASSGEFSSTTPSLASASAADGFMIFDSDSVNFPNSPNYVPLTGELISPTIDLTAQTGVILSMQQDFRYCCGPTHEISVSVSSDGGTSWSTPYDLIQGLTPDGNGTHTVSANISADAAGNTIQLKFTWDGSASGITHYYWAFDDICISATPVNDIIASEPYFGTNGLSYYQIPMSQIQPIDFSARATNNGSAAQTNVSLDIDVDNGAFTTSSSGITLNSWSDSLLELTGQFTPPATLGTVNIDLSIYQDEADEDSLNNQLPIISIDIVDNSSSVYARDNGTPDGVIHNNGDGFEAGNIFEIFTATNLLGIEVEIGSQAIPGAFIQAKLYSIDTSNNFIHEDVSYFHTITAGNIGHSLTIPLLSSTSGGFPLCQDRRYLITVASDGDGGLTNDLVISTGGASPEQTSFFFDATLQDWFYTLATPAVRMILNGTNGSCAEGWGVEELTAITSFSIRPNPTTGTSSIDYELAIPSNVSYEVRDLTGKLIIGENIGIKETGKQSFEIDINSFLSGAYFVHMITETETKIERFIKH